MSNRIYVDPPHLNIDEIIETGAFYLEDEPDVWYVECSPAYEWDVCIYDDCYSNNIILYGNGKERRIHDISMGTRSIDIMLRTQRYKCKDCGRTFRRPYDFVDTGKWITKRLKDDIRQKTLTLPFKQIAEEFGVTIPTISEIFKGYGEELDAKRKLVAPRVLGIDENHLGHTMRGIFTDIERGCLLEMSINRKKATMQKTIESMEGYDENIKFVCMDMTPAYKDMIHECCPKAIVIVDKYHVVRYITKATEYARSKIFADLKAQVAMLPDGSEKDDKKALLTRLGKDSYLFKYNGKKVLLDKSRASLMARLCDTFPELNELRIIKLRAEKIYGDSKDQYEAAQNITDFVKNIPAGSEYDKFREFSRTVKNWKTEILNYFKYGQKYTNAATEGINSFIKQLNGIGRGYSFEILRAKSLYWAEAHRKPTTARKKPSSYDPDKRSFVNPKDFLGKTIYLTGDMSDISILLDRFDEIF